MTLPVIRAEHLCKTFRLYRKPADRLKELILRKPFHTTHAALTDITFDVHAGETLGVVGQNGAGKSTLLKILNGVLLPDSGRSQVSGRITGLLELGTGFNMELSGLDNIRANAMLLGMDPDSIAARTERIIAFSELGHFIGEPLKTYSSGMIMRLGFAVAIHADPVCFIVDEALSVGDAYFQQKCMRAIQDFRARGGAILFVSHDMNAVKTLCDRAILLEAGRIIDHGSPREVVDHYHATILARSHQGDLPVEVRQRAAVDDPAAPLAATGQVALLDLSILDADDRRANTITSEHPVTLAARFRISRDLDDPHFGIGLRNRFGQSVFETNTYCMGRPTRPLAAGQSIVIRWQFVANLSAGDYAVSVGVGNRGYGTGSFDEILYFAHDVAMLKIGINPDAIRYDGCLNLRPDVAIVCDAAPVC